MTRIACSDHRRIMGPLDHDDHVVVFPAGRKRQTRADAAHTPSCADADTRQRGRFTDLPLCNHHIDRCDGRIATE
jgi:hypothetical protein